MFRPHIWVFSEKGMHFPRAVFLFKKRADKWIQSKNLDGVLSAYSIGVDKFDVEFIDHYHYGED